MHLLRGRHPVRREHCQGRPVCADGNAALAVVDEQRPDVVLMDVRMPGQGGLDSIREVLTRLAPPPSPILDAVRTVADGNAVVSPAATARVIAAATEPDSMHTRDRSREAVREHPSSLTDQERGSARVIVEGPGNLQIAERLCITVATVRTPSTL